MTAWAKAAVENKVSIRRPMAKILFIEVLSLTADRRAVVGTAGSDQELQEKGRSAILSGSHP
jgi:hypothetical protein